MNPPREPELHVGRIRPQAAHAPPPDADDPRVVEAVEEYLAELEAGQRPERHGFLARYAEIAPVLADCLDGLQFVHAVSPSLHRAGDPEEARRDPLGDFRIVREIGRGGMGLVYEAVQLSLGRRVALKVLPLLAALDSRQLQRFHNEAQAAAQLHHSNIVPVYAVGCERGVHYYAMQFIEGQSLAALIADARGAREEKKADQAEGADAAVTGEMQDSTAPAGPAALRARHAPRAPRRALFQAVARLGLKAAEALEHAHQLAVVHRDIKPANLLLDERGNLWVTDFGLALFQSDAGLTMTGEVLGTLRYMSPEQALGKRGVVDHRTDIYSLGVTLYELLTLRPAFDGQDRHELLQQITVEDPTPPRRLDPSVPVELETILLKAMAKGPADRYATARELADDLQRFLENRPIRARRPTLLERAARWGRRHRPLVVSGVLLLLTAALALLVTTLLIAREHAATRAAYERERHSAQEARAQRARAEENFRQARQAVDFFSRLGEELDEGAFAPGVRRQLLEAALGYYQDFLEQRQDPSIQADLAASRTRVTRLLEELAALQGSGQLLALKQRAVQDDLKLRPDQRQRVGQVSARIAEEWRAAFREFRKLGEDARRTRSLEIARAEEGAVAEVLTADQAARFRQILLQLRQRGPHGFADPEVVQALHLTAKQREKLRLIHQDAYQPPGKGWLNDGPPPKGKKRPGNRWREVNDKVMSVLTAEQRARWRELIGAPLLAEVQFTPPGRPGPPRGPGPPPGKRGPGGFGPPPRPR
jgi:serine/threonine protein kinase